MKRRSADDHSAEMIREVATERTAASGGAIEAVASGCTECGRRRPLIEEGA
jgi:hypothetical protein